ncbi:MAG: glycosyltransferase, partial [Promethearchaeota archaeon]
MKTYDTMHRKTEDKLRVLYFTPIFTFRYIKTVSYLTNEVNSIITNYNNSEILVYVTNRHNNIEIIKPRDRVLQVNRKSYKNFLFIKDMIKIFRRFKPNIVHSHYVVPSIIINLFAKIFKVPTILHGRGQDMNDFPYVRIKNKLLLIIAGKLKKMILTVSKSMKEDCLRFKIKKNKIKVIYNGINSKKFSPKKKDFYLNQRQLELIHIGSITRRKGQHLIVEACKMLKGKNINFHLTLIGGGRLRENLIELIKKYELEDSIDLYRRIDHNDLPGFLEKADLLVFP